MSAADPYGARIERLEASLASLPDLLVAFSGGVDSAVLLASASRVLGDRAAGFLADSPSLPREELVCARAVAASLGARLFVDATDELSDPRYRANAGQRCYFCKGALFDSMAACAEAEGFTVLAFGEIADDALDDRPGARRARELGVRAPLAGAGLTKADVRRRARELGLSVADKPAAACLASRIPVGTEVTRARLARVEAAERDVRELGFRVLRVRDRGRLARVEVGETELPLARRERSELARRLSAHGFAELELDAYVVPAGRS